MTAARTGDEELVASILEFGSPSAGSTTVLPPPADVKESQPRPAVVGGTEKALPVILLVEDNPGDERLVREALAKGKASLRLFVAHDGLEALRFLRGAAQRPDLILLDLNLVGMDGRTLLQRIKSDPELLQIPVIVVSGSESSWDVSGAYHLHANCYVVKPTAFQGYVQAIGRLLDFWVGTVRLPDR